MFTKSQLSGWIINENCWCNLHYQKHFDLWYIYHIWVHYQMFTLLFLSLVPKVSSITCKINISMFVFSIVLSQFFLPILMNNVHVHYFHYKLDYCLMAIFYWYKFTFIIMIPLFLLQFSDEEDEDEAVSVINHRVCSTMPVLASWYREKCRVRIRISIN